MKIKQLWVKYNSLPFSIHPLFFIFGIMMIMFDQILVFVVTTIIALLHELAHSIVAKRYGYSLKKIRLLPFGAEVSGETDFLPKQEIVIAIAGPISNFIFSILCVCLWWLVPESYSYLMTPCAVSLVCGIFNLFPFFPLDGGRIFLAVLSQKTDRKTAIKIAKWTTIGFSALLFIVFVISLFFTPNFSFGMMSIGLVACAMSEAKDLKYERITSLSKKRKKLSSGIENKTISFVQDVMLKKLFTSISAKHYTTFEIYDKEMNKLYEITETKLEELLNEYPSTTLIKDLKIK